MHSHHRHAPTSAALRHSAEEDDELSRHRVWMRSGGKPLSKVSWLHAAWEGSESIECNLLSVLFDKLTKLTV